MKVYYSSTAVAFYPADIDQSMYGGDVMTEAWLYQRGWDFLEFLILYSNLIPISLYVTLECQKLMGAWLIEWDENMYDEDLDEPVQARCSDINEDLGQIEYVFADKTGTLTQNTMVFKKCSIRGMLYTYCAATGQLTQGLGQDVVRPEDGDGDNCLRDFFLALAICNTITVTVADDDAEGAEGAEGGGGPTSALGPAPALVPPARGEAAARGAGEAYEGDRGDMGGMGPSSPAQARVQPARTGPEAGGSVGARTRYHYASTSPDEEALVRVTPCMGLRVTYRALNYIDIEDSAPAPHGATHTGGAATPHPGGTRDGSSGDGAEGGGGEPESGCGQDPGGAAPRRERYKVLHVCQFNSFRMRMSVLAEDEDGQVVLFCKGADSVVLARCTDDSLSGPSFTPGSQAQAPPPARASSGNGGGADGAGGGAGGGADTAARTVRRRTAEHLHRFSREGLRTLAVAKKLFTTAEAEQAIKNIEFAEKLIEGRSEALAELYDGLETAMTFVGASAVEDKLQEDVCETMELLRDAGCRLWVLTGDKMETAMNISLSVGQSHNSNNDSRNIKHRACVPFLISLALPRAPPMPWMLWMACMAWRGAYRTVRARKRP